MRQSLKAPLLLLVLSVAAGSIALPAALLAQTADSEEPAKKTLPAKKPVIAAKSPLPAKPVPAKKPPHDKYGSPLDTLRETHLRADVPQAEDFVRATRPAAKDLDYTPLTGVDPERPKPRDKANVMALQAEMEQAGVIAQGKGRLVQGSARATKAKVAKAKAKAAE